MSIAETIDLYAKSFYSLVQEQSCHEQIKLEISSCAELIGLNRDFSKVLESPCIAVATQLELIKQVALCYGWSHLTINLLCVLIVNKRRALISPIIKAVLLLISASKGEEVVGVKVASPLAEGDLEYITTYLSETLGKTVSIDLSVNPEILGGMVVQRGSVLYDNSISSQLKAIKNITNKVIAVI
jgi:F-type H+-transporting ATPase subunit delta